MPAKLYTYRIVTDAGTAPHVGDGILTLTLCKPGIRKSAKVGDYVLALVALQHEKITGKGEDRYYKAAYLFQISEVVPMSEYEGWCKVHASSKICTNSHFEGDCQYNAAGTWRPGPHNSTHRERNLGGKFSLVSRKFAAWTSAAPRTLTETEMAAIGLDTNKVKTATRNFFGTDLNEAEQIAALDAIIAEKAEKAAADVEPPCKGKSCGAAAKGGSFNAQANKVENRLRRLSSRVLPHELNNLAKQFSRHQKTKRHENIQRSVSPGIVEEMVKKIDPTAFQGGGRRTRRLRRN